MYKGESKTKANVTLILADETMTQLAEGKVRFPSPNGCFLCYPCIVLTPHNSMQLDGQKAFMTGKLKTKGNMMFATKLDGVLKVRQTFLSPQYVQLFTWNRSNRQPRHKRSCRSSRSTHAVQDTMFHIYQYHSSVILFHPQVV